MEPIIFNCESCFITLPIIKCVSADIEYLKKGPILNLAIDSGMKRVQMCEKCFSTETHNNPKPVIKKD